MWQWILCYLSGQHDYGVNCEPGEIYLRCRGCGRRSSGWELRQENTVARAHARSSRVPGLLQAQAAVRREHFSA
jgi:hypothetical protein